VHHIFSPLMIHSSRAARRTHARRQPITACARLGERERSQLAFARMAKQRQQWRFCSSFPNRTYRRRRPSSLVSLNRQPVEPQPSDLLDGAAPR